mgnify:FL=1
MENERREKSTIKFSAINLTVDGKDMGDLSRVVLGAAIKKTLGMK